jgi:hypothetical protein
MSDIKRDPEPGKYVEPHLHTCPNCKRPYSCACQAQPTKESLVCRDCETATYEPAIHGGRGTKKEA